MLMAYDYQEPSWEDAILEMQEESDPDYTPPATPAEVEKFKRMEAECHTRLV